MSNNGNLLHKDCKYLDSSSELQIPNRGINVYFNAFDRYINCVDVRTGGLVWKQFMNGSSESSPFIDETTKSISPNMSGISKY